MYFSEDREGLYKGIIPNFDNTARRRDYAHILQLSPKLYQEWLYDIIKYTNDKFKAGNRFIFINAWNEWAEGAHLEPDRKYGYAYLQATADVVAEIKGKPAIFYDMENDTKNSINLHTKRLSCKLLESTIALDLGKEYFSLTVCCGVAGHSQYPRIIIPQDIYYESIDDYDKLACFIKNEREKLILTLGEEGHVCEGCPSLEYDIYPPKTDFLLHFNNNMTSACNCRCFYCNNSAEALVNYPEDILEKANKIDFVELAKGFERCGLTNMNTAYGWSSGEFTISRQKEKVLNFGKYRQLVILSNGIIFDRQMAEWMSDSSVGGILNISLDSGTRSTFNRIKGVDAYDRVCENVRKYAKNRVKDFELKFVFCEGYNDNELDVDGFIEVAKSASVSWVAMDRNYQELQKPLAPETIKAVQRFYDKAINANITVGFRPAFTQEQVKLIKS
jgi:pyruvate-formate lyase-activating enzyme